jgi:hypothetical protein
MQTRSKSSRRKKVTVRWLPVELIIEIFTSVQELIGRWEFKLDCYDSMKLHQDYCNNLLAFALSSKEWTAIAQAELFRHVILRNRRKTWEFLELVRERKEFRNYTAGTISIRLGEVAKAAYDVAGLGHDLDEIALYCPNVVEISCHRLAMKLEYFRTSFHLIFSEAAR